jgi:glycosyltransferase involved in cell wall biosynthesis
LSAAADVDRNDLAREAGVTEPRPAPAGVRRPRILTFTDYYLPGYKGGGGIRTLANMVDRLGGELEFDLVTRDRDLGDTRAYPLPDGQWLPAGTARVHYLPMAAGFSEVSRLVRESGADAVYLNSFFSPRFTLMPLLAARLARLPVPVVIAPRGEFSPGALTLKRWKKIPFVATARAVRLFDGLLWQVSSPREEEDVRRWFGSGARVCVAPDLSGPVPADPGPPPAKAPGELRVVFLSRISRKKNLDGALRMLAGVRGRVHLTINGPVHDTDYWAECQRLIARLPANVQVDYAGPVPHDRIHEALRGHHVFVLPTHGENFGHAILEAMLAGLPVVVSDQTPWSGLEALGVGADLPLAAPAAFTGALQRFMDMDGEAFAMASGKARRYAVRRSLDPELEERNRDLFRRALSGR